MVLRKFDILLVEALGPLNRTDNLAERGYIMQLLIEIKSNYSSSEKAMRYRRDFAGEIDITI